MKELSLEKVKEYQFNTLVEVANFCEINKINYSLAYGTLIGAIRHKGYIPWDDDIDIMMLREDYERFCKIFSSEHYKVYTYTNCKDYNFPFAKVSDERTILVEYLNTKRTVGVNIDIFPIDNLSNDIEASKKIYDSVQIYMNIMTLKLVKITKRRNWLKNVILLINQIAFVFIPMRWLIRVVDNKAQKCRGKKSNYVGDVVSGCYGAKAICTNIGYDEFVDLEFEGRLFKAIKSYDTYLTNVYGDYMTLPSVDKQVTHHDFTAFKK